jgi:hypothetical protein
MPIDPSFLRLEVAFYPIAPTGKLVNEIARPTCDPRDLLFQLGDPGDLALQLGDSQALLANQDLRLVSLQEKSQPQVSVERRATYPRLRRLDPHQQLVSQHRGVPDW